MPGGALEVFGAREVIGQHGRVFARVVRKGSLDPVADPPVILFRIGSDRMRQRFADQVVTEPVSWTQLGEPRLQNLGIDQPRQARQDLVFASCQGFRRSPCA